MYSRLLVTLLPPWPTRQSSLCQSNAQTELASYITQSLSESVQSVSSNSVHQRLRSASSLDFIVPWTRTKFGDRAFSVAGPTVWSSLPESVRSAETLASFKCKLKTYLFNISFNWLLSFINIVMLSCDVFVVGWVVN